MSFSTYKKFNKNDIVCFIYLGTTKKIAQNNNSDFLGKSKFKFQM